MGIISTKLAVSSTLAAGANIPVGSVVHKCGCNLRASGNTWFIEGAGCYKVTANVSVAPAAAGSIDITLFDNGAPVATASGVVATAGDVITLPLQYVDYNKCGCSTDQLTLTVSAAATVTESDVIIERGVA